MSEEQTNNSDTGTADEAKANTKVSDKTGSPGASTFGFETILGKLPTLCKLCTKRVDFVGFPPTLTVVHMSVDG